MNVVIKRSAQSDVNPVVDAVLVTVLIHNDDTRERRIVVANVTRRDAAVGRSTGISHAKLGWIDIMSGLG